MSAWGKGIDLVREPAGAAYDYDVALSLMATTMARRRNTVEISRKNIFSCLQSNRKSKVLHIRYIRK